MIIGSKDKHEDVMALIPAIQESMDEWQMLNISILRESQLTRDQVLERLLNKYKEHKGFIYPASPTKIIMGVRFGVIDNYAIMKKHIEESVPNNCCHITLKKMSPVGLKHVQTDLTQSNNNMLLEDTMFDQRQKRRQNMLLIADDDAFIRKAMKKLLLASGVLIEAGDSKAVVTQYINKNPDVLFLDIHMPGKNGLELIQDIMEVDPDAYIVLLSADSSPGNVLKALEEGAVGFLSKPPSKKKVQDYLSQCITVR